MTDPIVDEVRRIRDAHATQFDYDLDAIFRDIKEQEKKSGLTYVSYPPRRIAPILSPGPITLPGDVTADTALPSKPQ